MANPEPVFKLDNGDLSAYSFACGYVQQITVGNVKIEMYHQTPMYHVRLFDTSLRDAGEPLPVWRQWDSFDTLTEARKHYAALVRKEKAK